MNGQLCFRFKTGGRRGKRFHKSSRHRSVSGQDIRERITEQQGHGPIEQSIPKTMPRPIGPFTGFDTNPHHHINVIGNQGLNQRAG